MFVEADYKEYPILLSCSQTGCDDECGQSCRSSGVPLIVLDGYHRIAKLLAVDQSRGARTIQAQFVMASTLWECHYE